MIDTDSLDAVCVVATEERADHIEEGFPGGAKEGQEVRAGGKKILQIIQKMSFIIVHNNTFSFFKNIMTLSQLTLYQSSCLLYI